MLTATTSEMLPRLQPNVSWSGVSSAPGAARTPADTSSTRNVAPTTTQA